MQRSMDVTGPASSERRGSSAAIPAIPHIKWLASLSRDLAVHLRWYRTESAPAVRVVVLDAHFTERCAVEPRRELIFAQVERDRRDQVIEHDRAQLAVRERADVREVRRVRQCAV